MAIAPASEEGPGVDFLCAGAWNGTVHVPSLEVTAGYLRERVAEISGVCSAEEMKLIAVGRNLLDNSKSLKDYGVKVGSRLIVLRGSSAAGSMARQEAQARENDSKDERLQRLKKSAEAMAARSGGDVDMDSWDFSLENQAGTALTIGNPEDRKALIMGLALHEKGRRTLTKGDYSAALDELLLAEEAFDMVNPSLLESVDNQGMLCLDVSWCYFKLQDAGKLAECRRRLAQARSALRRAHGPAGERLRTLHGNFKPELAIYARLELLEGIAAYHAGLPAVARPHIVAAADLCRQLEVSDDDLSTLAAMGFQTNEAVRALRFSGGDLEKAVEIAFEQQKAVKERAELRKVEKKRAREQQKYGKTATGKRVDMDLLDRLAALGYERPLAAEAMRQADNDFQLAIDMLVDPERNMLLQQARRNAPSTFTAGNTAAQVDEGIVASLVAMGFPEAMVRSVLQHFGGAGDVMQRAVEMLTGGEAQAGALAAALSNIMTANPSQGNNGSPPHATQEDGRAHGAGPSSPAPPQAPERDEEMENELAANVGDGDPLASYDVDVADEVQAVQQYLALLGTPP